LLRLDQLEAAIRTNECPFKTVVIDTIDNLADYGEAFICKKFSINTLGDLDYGKGYAYYKKEIIKQLRRISQLGLGLIFISHAQEKDVLASAVINPYAPITADSKTGKVSMIVPTLEKRAYEFISGLSDMIFYLEIDNQGNRVIRTQPNKNFEAGDRSGRLPATVNLDYEELLKFYYDSNNGKLPTELINRLNLAEQYLAQYSIDGFNVPTRVQNSRKKHLDNEKFEGVDIKKLESYLQHLRIKAKNAKKENTK